ncbi:MAG: radical SAM protein [Candidatus Aenigmarchaeota archaeon]|nr:radical SAM protein [Candidatus Aenigmarchaeota archaeon]
MKKIYTLFYLIFLELRRIIFRIKYFAEVDVTDNCNLRCKHCYHFHGKNEFKTKELSLDVWRERFNDLHKAGIRFILLVGGEPALRNDILMLADNIFPFVYVITNGTIKIPMEFNHLLFVSLDGMRERNDSIRGKGVFSKVMKNYSGDKRVAINMTITKDNYKDLVDIVKFAKESGFRGVVCNICASGIDVEIPMFVRKNERKMIIEELKRVKLLYPKDFLLSKTMIKWYEYPDHRGSCHWGDEVLHFDVSWNKRRCFAKADCSNCGCLAGSFENPLKMLKYPKEMKKLV